MQLECLDEIGIVAVRFLCRALELSENDFDAVDCGEDNGDRVGCRRRSIADAADTDAILAGEDPVPLPRREPAGLRLALSRGRLLSGLDKEVESAFDRALTLLKKAGAYLAEIDLEPLLDHLDQIHAMGSITAVEAAYVHRDALANRADEIDQRVVRRIKAGSNVSGADYVRMLELRRAAIERAAEQFAPFDAIVLSTWLGIYAMAMWVLLLKMTLKQYSTLWL